MILSSTTAVTSQCHIIMTLPQVNIDWDLYFCHGMKIKLCSYVIRSPRHPSGSQRLGLTDPWLSSGSLLSRNNTVLLSYRVLHIQVECRSPVMGRYLIIGINTPDFPTNLVLQEVEVHGVAGDYVDCCLGLWWQARNHQHSRNLIKSWSFLKIILLCVIFTYKIRHFAEHDFASWNIYK